MKKNWIWVAAMSIFLVGLTVIGLAKPAFMDRYNANPYSKTELRGKCTVCHLGRGGGERNDFGEAFEDAGYRITPKLRAKFPQLFEKKPSQDMPEAPKPPAGDLHK